MTPRLALAVAFAAVSVTAAPANEFSPMLQELARSEIAPMLSDPAIIAAVRAQNARTAGLSQAEIEALDREWRGQVGTSAAPLVDEVTGGTAAELLRSYQAASGGLYSEIFVMDGVGLNVAASDATSDYWQGDEAKWQESYGAGPDAVHIGEIEFDESSQSYLSQVSLPVTDPDTGAPIGAATFGINVELLN